MFNWVALVKVESPLVWFFLWLPEEVLTLLFLLHCDNGDFYILMKDIFCNFHNIPSYLLLKNLLIILLLNLKVPFMYEGCSLEITIDS
jgi:hypothetical protein